MRAVKFAIAIPQFFADGEFDPAAYRAYFARAEELGFDSAWAQENMLGAAPQLGPLEAMTYAAACTQRMRLGCVVFVSTLHSPVHLAKSLSLAGPAQPRPDRDRRRHRRQGAAVRRLRRGPAAVRRAVHRGHRADEGAVDRAPRHLRRGVLAAAGRGDGTQAVPEAATRRCGSARTARSRCAGPCGWATASSARAPRPPRGSPSRSRSCGRRSPRRAARPRTSPSPSACTSLSTRTPGAARRRMNEAMEHLYGRRSADIEAAAIAGTPADCVAAAARGRRGRRGADPVHGHV